MKVELTSRQQRILWATVRSYITTAEPVGSRTLADNFDLGVSTATIRNVMAMLEQGGLLHQPHTSAGRVPSDSGYRVYVDELRDPKQEDAMQAVVAERLGEQLNENLDMLLHNATQLLSTLTGYIALISTPPTDASTLRHLQIVPVDEGRLMVIVVTDAYQTHTVLVNLQNDMPGLGYQLSAAVLIQPEELQLLSNFLNDQLRGMSFVELAKKNWAEVDRAFQHYAEWLRQLFQVVLQGQLRPAVGQVFMGGVRELMRQPEFMRTQHLQMVVDLLEDNQAALWQALSQPQPGRVVVRIGAENDLEPIRNCSLVSTGYGCGDLSWGTVSLLGPTRMMYETAIASVKATASHLSQTLTNA